MKGVVMKSISETLAEVNADLTGAPKPYDHLYRVDENRSYFPQALLDMEKDERKQYFRG